MGEPATVSYDFKGSRTYGAVRALDGVDFCVAPASASASSVTTARGNRRCTHVLNGGVAADSGRREIRARRSGWNSAARAKALGGCARLPGASLCPNLTVAENARIVHPSIRGSGWRGRAGRLICGSLDGYLSRPWRSPDDLVQNLSIGRRQMVEISARAFTVRDSRPAGLRYLDQPTGRSKLHTAGQLLAYVRRSVAEGLSCVLISHILGEVLKRCDRILVMRDGKVVMEDRVDNLSRAKLVAAMGGVER